jgi:hypothetical protein
VTKGLYVLGLQLSAAQWGTAIAAEARQKDGPAYPSGQRTLRDADEIARGILGFQPHPKMSMPHRTRPRKMSMPHVRAHEK